MLKANTLQFEYLENPKKYIVSLTPPISLQLQLLTQKIAFVSHPHNLAAAVTDTKQRSSHIPNVSAVVTTNTK